MFLVIAALILLDTVLVQSLCPRELFFQRQLHRKIFAKPSLPLHRNHSLVIDWSCHYIGLCQFLGVIEKFSFLSNRSNGLPDGTTPLLLVNGSTSEYLGSLMAAEMPIGAGSAAVRSFVCGFVTSCSSMLSTGHVDFSAPSFEMRPKMTQTLPSCGSAFRGSQSSPLSHFSKIRSSAVNL